MRRSIVVRLLCGALLVGSLSTWAGAATRATEPRPSKRVVHSALMDLRLRVEALQPQDLEPAAKRQLVAAVIRASHRYDRQQVCAALRIVDALRTPILSAATWRRGRFAPRRVGRIDPQLVRTENLLLASRGGGGCAQRSKRLRTLPAQTVAGGQYPARHIETGEYNDEGEDAGPPRRAGAFRPLPQPRRLVKIEGAPHQSNVKKFGAAHRSQLKKLGASIAFPASPIEPVKLFVNKDLNERPAEFSGGPIDPSAASSGDVVVFTGNPFLAFSEDSGANFTYINPTTIFKDNPDGGFCCDQVVQYDPFTDRFLWLSQYWCSPAGNRCNGDPTKGTVTTQENRLRLAVASPKQLRDSNGTNWTYHDFTSKTLGLTKHWMDRPDMAVGAGRLYITVNSVPNDGALWLRFSTSALSTAKQSETVPFDKQFIKGGFLVAAVQNASGRAYAAWNTSTTSLEVDYWDPASTLYVPNEVAISSIPTENCVSTTPAGFDWLGFGGCPAGVPRWAITGATVRASANQLWLAWGAGRAYAGRTSDTFALPHVELAVIDQTTFKLVGPHQEVLMNASYAMAYPTLHTNVNDEVGMAFNWGGNGMYVNDGVGFLTGKRELRTVAFGSQGGGRYGDYLAVRPHFPNAQLLSAANFVTTTPNPPGFWHPRWTLFGRAGDFIPSRPGQPPDLVISELGKDSVSVANVGGTQAGPFKLRLSHASSSIPTLEWSLSGLAPGDAIRRAFFCYAGTRTASADVDGKVKESDETNNQRKLTLTGCIS